MSLARNDCFSPETEDHRAATVLGRDDVSGRLGDGAQRVGALTVGEAHSRTAVSRSLRLRSR